jgi:hypothetical protein
MNDQNPNPTPTPGTPPPAPGDWRAQRYAERMARHEERMKRFGTRRHGWTWGVLLILLGAILLLENLKIAVLTNWWALFILIPAFWSYIGSWESIQESGKFTRRAASSLTVAILLTVVSLVFLLNLSFGLYWPILLIAGGVALLLSGSLPE